MSTARKTPVIHTDDEGNHSFDVTIERVIGTVDLNGRGYPSPMHAALAIIANDGDEGTYRFPAADGRTVVVTLALEPADD